jgi:2,4-dienoyl-CoA reductase (NADPH2)
MEFPSLFSPIRLAGVIVPNRIVMAAMSSALGADDGSVTPELIAFLSARAAGGVGMVTVEFTCVDTRFGRAEVKQLSLDGIGNFDGHWRLAQAIRARGSVPCLQLHMPGRFAEPRTLDGRLPAAPSECFARDGVSLVARAFTSAEVGEIVEHYARAARTAVLANYQAIEIHGAHGYLPMAFLSPRSNRRDDEWGGDFERRLAFPCAVLRAVKKELGRHLPLIYRMSSSEFVAGGLDIEDCERIVPHLVQAGADALHVTSGTMHGSFEKMVDSMAEPEGWRFAHAARLKAAARVPVIAIGPTRWPAAAEAALAQGQADLIALGRPLLTDPDWPRKAAGGLAGQIRPCTNCNWCMERVRAHEPIGCAENPRTGREFEDVQFPTEPSVQRVVVVGAGPAGLTAAICLDRAGVDTHLYERRSTLGGGLIASAAPPGKDKLNWYLDYLVGQLARSGVNVHLGSTLDADALRRISPDAGLVATGAAEVGFDIPGIDNGIVRSAYDILMGDAGIDVDPTVPVVVYGGGETGCEVTEYLVDQGFHVALITRSAATDLARGAELMYGKLLRRRLLGNPGVALIEKTTIVSIGEQGVAWRNASGETGFTVAGAVVMAQGRIPLSSAGIAFSKADIPYQNIGDASGIGRIGDAVHEAFDAVESLLRGSGAPAGNPFGVCRRGPAPLARPSPGSREAGLC